MSHAPFRVPPPPPVTVEVAAANVYTALASLALLTADIVPPGVDAWVATTAARLTPDERRNNRLVFAAFGEALRIDHDRPSFDAYLDELAALAPTVLRDRIVRPLAQPAVDRPALSVAEIVADPDLYLIQLGRAYPGDPVDPQEAREAHALLGDPPALQRLLVGHLRHMWSTYLASEFRALQHYRGAMIQLLQSREWPAVTAVEAIRAFIGREVPPAISAQLDGVLHVVLTVSPHIGPFAARFGSPDTIWVFVRGRSPGHRSNQRPMLDLPVRQAPIKRAELIGPFSALSDETRLQIMELLSTGELSAQQIIARLDLSQSGISRHLKQLVSSGFVEERRGEGANKLYQLNEARIEWVFYALHQLLRQAPEPPEAAPPVERPAELQRFVDGAGKIVAWPSRRRDQLLVLAYLAEQFEPDRSYTEREVNELIDSQIVRLKKPATTNRGDNVPIDYVTVRRELFEAQLIRRTPDGSRYWREENIEHRT